MRVNTAPVRYAGSRNSYFTSRRRSYNSYLRGGRTYGRLTQYYLPANYYNGRGYYSYRYLKKYYDGYGYNFYTGKYNYYEAYNLGGRAYNGRVVRVGGGGGPLGGIIGVVIIVMCCIICCCWHVKRGKGDIEEEEEIVEEVVEEIFEEEVICEDQPMVY